jgi:small subunit ribosomal protein S9
MQILAKSVGRRKEAVAQVQIVRGTGLFMINNKPAQEYLQTDTCSLKVKAPFEILSQVRSNQSFDNTNQNILPITETAQPQNIDTIVKVKGGGLMGQAEAIRLGIARALCVLTTNSNLNDLVLSNGESSELPTESETTTNSSDLVSSSLDVRKQLKDKGYLTQDARVKERRKYGLKKARKASQYHKR